LSSDPNSQQEVSSEYIEERGIYSNDDYKWVERQSVDNQEVRLFTAAEEFKDVVQQVKVDEE
jgi:hypothetical protein